MTTVGPPCLLINSPNVVSVHSLNSAHRQICYSLRMDCAPAGAAAVVAECDVAAVVDILSFTTTLSVAVDRDVTVFPYRWR
jgi:2-phosphosulfolactate phosphatase